MKNKLFLFLSLVMLIFVQSQNLHIKYTYVNPVNFLVHEDLYISGVNALGIRDSVMIKNTNEQLHADGNNTRIFGKTTKQKVKYYRSSLNETMIIHEYIDDHSYWIKDELPKIVWNTNYSETKKIGTYICKKATTVFRGSKITAYYTPDLPYAFGPYKFAGLPGVILEVGEDDNAVNSWKAESIEFTIPNNVILTAPEEKTITYREFIHLQDKKNEDEVKRLTAKLPNNGTVMNIEQPKRTAIEKIYEWE
ncbi:GLPGLI family protein [Chryseobacterium sp.]|uniref:GLPGLI family protein n=1 Tax=Chryseobacterium sp. TaxID=1871047 RepID=UPI002638BA98|nr:GLPGLI family protein [Chryseobacterium sp.]